jgi:superfamily II DNA or RNA helicase
MFCNQYKKIDLITLAVQRLGWKVSVARRTKNKDLCEALGIRERRPDDIIQEKVCTDRKRRIYPNRYTKDELIDIIRTRNPFSNRAKLRRSSFKILCPLARIPFQIPEKTASDRQKQSAIGKMDRHRYFQELEQKTEQINCMIRGRKKPMLYQQRVIEHFQRHRGLIAVHSLGSGKTLTAVYASQCYLDQFPDRKVVVISPASLIDNFKKEMRDFGDIRHTDRYEFFSFQGFYNQYKNQSRNCRHHFLIIDEAHNLRTEYTRSKKTGKDKGKYNKVITNCAERADKILLLTATPLVNKSSDIASLLNMVRDNPTAQNKITRSSIDKNTLSLREASLCRVSFYERDRVNADYPTARVEDIFLPMPPQFYEMYIDVENEIMQENIMRIFGEESKLKPFFNGVRRAVNILSELPEKELLKSPKVRWILEELRNKNTKTVIFSNFLDMGLQVIIERLPPNIRAAYITGSQPKHIRTAIVREYNANNLDILFISRAGGEGLDLKGTRRMILLESGWNENAERQVIGRGVRYQSHSHLPEDERFVDIYRLHHVKPEEVDQIEYLLSSDYTVDYNDPSTWLSADLMLRKIAQDKLERTEAFIEQLKEFSIERNAC